MQEMRTPLFEMGLKRQDISLKLASKSLANVFGRMDFYSRLLHSLAPDERRVWQETSRLDYEISGWPKEIRWQRSGEQNFTGKISNVKKIDLEDYSQILENALTDITTGSSSSTGSKLYKFSIVGEKDIFDYEFHSRSRTIAALCVLFDLQPHPRNDLEINIPRRLGPQDKWPLRSTEGNQRTYGDPSKTADELRNEGWTRSGDHKAMDVRRERIAGQIQQMYRISTQKQTKQAQVMRSNIPKRWKKALFEAQDYTCQICLVKHDESLLEPDHRIPVIIEADELTEANYKDKLMTLCRFCNQQKRETTKRLPDDYDWENSPWAYPEKFFLESASRQLAAHCETTGLSKGKCLDAVKKMMGAIRNTSK